VSRENTQLLSGDVAEAIPCFWRCRVAILILSGLLLGTILGRRFKIYILFPTYAFAFILMIAKSRFVALDIWTAAAETAVLMICLQLGYIIGLASTDPSVVTKFVRKLRRQEAPAARSRSIHP
jgi:hypothetical protein